MAHGLDRLERLFASKRKASAVSVTEPNSPVSQTSEPVFPSPSFIRPKAARMTAREDVRQAQPSGRSHSATGALAPRRTPSAKGRSSSTTSMSSPARRTAFQPLSCGDDHRDSLLTELQEYQFPQPPSQDGELLPLLIALDPETASELSGRRSPRSESPSQLKRTLQRLDTPPSTDPEDNEPSPKRLMNKKLPPIPCPALLTPNASPTLGPVGESQLRESKPIDILDKDLFRDIQLRLGQTIDQSLIRRSWSDSSLAQSSRHSRSGSHFREPNFDDFLDLSDEDIAEEAPRDIILPPGPELPPTPSTMSSAAAATGSRPSSLLTLTPSCASRPATTAAFEIAKIANRYNFDFVYVANLWHESVTTPESSPRSDLGPCLGFDPSRKNMAGRLLAAYGLHHVKSPFRISPAVHAKILQSNGWIEYRSQATRHDEFARGYARSFYTGRYARSGSIDSSTTSSSTSSTRAMDRGVVFAAYRKPRADGTIRFSDQQELKRVHRDAEVLVEMLIDNHAANRVRQFQIPTVDDMSVMPRQKFACLGNQGLEVRA